MDVQITCVCGRHDHDVVTLRDTLDFRAAVTVRNAALMAREEPGVSASDILAALSEAYILVGVESWTLADAKGKPIPVDRPAIREHLLSHPEVALEIADAADALYSEKVVLPLLFRASSSSPPGQIVAPTSAKTSGPSVSRRRSSPSSTTSIPTGGTAPITPLRAGASST
jgi:hypothetical protein